MSKISILSPSQASEALASSNFSIPSYLTPNFLNQIYGKSWKSLVVTLEHYPIAYFPFFLSKAQFRYLRCSSFPLIPFTQFFFSLHNKNPIKEFERQRSVILEISRFLKGKFNIIQINVASENPYLSPFLWEGYQISVRYEFVLPQALGKPYMKWSSDVKRRIKRANELGYTLVEPSFQEACQLYQHMLPSLWAQYEPFLKAFFQIQHSNLLKIGAKDSHGRLVAIGTFLKTDRELIYNIGVHHKEDRFGAPFLLDHAITLAFDEGLNFHFGGSMIPSIDHFFGSFGAQPMPRYQIHYKPLIYRLWEIFTS